MTFCHTLFQLLFSAKKIILNTKSTNIPESYIQIFFHFFTSYLPLPQMYSRFPFKVHPRQTITAFIQLLFCAKTVILATKCFNLAEKNLAPKGPSLLSFYSLKQCKLAKDTSNLDD